MRKLNIRFYILVTITILYGLCLGYLIKSLSLENNINDLLAYIGTILSIVICLVSCLILHKKRYVYVSYTQSENTDDAFKKLKAIYKKSILITVLDGIEPGDCLYDSMMVKIHESNFCIVLIDKELSSFQKKEIKEMKKQNKKIIPILVSKDTKIPKLLSNISFSTL